MSRTPVTSGHSRTPLLGHDHRRVATAFLSDLPAGARADPAAGSLVLQQERRPPRAAALGCQVYSTGPDQSNYNSDEGPQLASVAVPESEFQAIGYHKIGETDPDEITTLMTGDTETLKRLSTQPNLYRIDDAQLLGFFELPYFADENAAGYSARPPGIQSHHGQERTLIALQTSNATGRPVAEIDQPLTATDERTTPMTDSRQPDPANYYVSTPGQSTTFYTVPDHLSTEAILADSSNELPGAQVATMTPPDGRVEGSDLVWRASGALQPEVSLGNIAYQDMRASNEFYSGLAFATAANGLALSPAALLLPAKTLRGAPGLTALTQGHWPLRRPWGSHLSKNSPRKLFHRRRQKAETELDPDPRAYL